MTFPAGLRTIWFHRAFKVVTGGEVKHAHYFAHARQMEGFEARIAFTGGPLPEALQRERRRTTCCFWPARTGAT